MLKSPGTEIPFTNGYYRSGRSLSYSAQRLINYKPSIANKPALSRRNLYMTEGVREIIEATTGANRGSIKFDGKAYFVNAQKLYRVDQTINPDLTETYTKVELGTIGGTGRCVFAAGQLDLVVVVPGQFSYSWNDGTSTFTELDSLPNFRTAQDVKHINSLFVFLEADSNIVFHSDFNDPTTYNALAFDQVFQITKGVGLLEYQNNLYVMGESKTIPFVYQSVGLDTDNFFFTPQPNAVIPVGLRSVFAKVDIRDSILFLGGGDNEEPGVYAFPQNKISDETIDNVIQNLTDDQINESFMMKHTQNDSPVVVLTAGNECFCYDIKTDCWHERRSTVNEQDLRWRVNSIVQCYNRLLVGDYIDGRIGIIDDQVYTEYGNIVTREFITQPFDNRGQAIKVQSLILMMDSGFGGEITMYYSDKGGLDGTWSNGVTNSAGDSGEYGRCVRFDRLGSSSFTKVFRFVVHNDKPCNINKIYAI